jgi:hypothetical protein
MTLIELYNNGTIKQLCSKGIVSVNTLAYFDYYFAFQSHRKASSYREAVMLTSLQFKVSESTVERAVRTIQEQPSKS